MANQIQENSILEEEGELIGTRIREESEREEERATEIQEESAMGKEKLAIHTVNIVVAVNESQESLRACKWACKHFLADHTNMGQSYNFTLVYVQPPVCVSSGPAYIFSGEVVHMLEHEEVRNTQKILKRAMDICNYYNVKAKTLVVTGGNAKEKICEVAQKKGAHFLVMGSRGHGPFI
ncbi:hypothetical protein KI387_001149, partial [Taxus chinensis]